MFLPTQALRLLESRPAVDRLTPLEYVFGFLRLIDFVKTTGKDPAPYELHLRQVICDANTYDWEAVRTWSNEVFERLENREIDWSSPEIQTERSRVSWKAKVDRSDELNQVPCNLFNSLDEHKRCTFDADHVTLGVTHMHTCAICFFAKGMRRTQHPAKACFARKALSDQKQEPSKRNDRNPQQTHEPRPWVNNSGGNGKRQQHSNSKGKPKN